MKIRTDFVTNSSSSSFVLVGYKLPFNVELVETILSLVYDIDEKSIAEYKDENHEDDWLYKAVCELTYESDIDFVIGEEDGAPSKDTMLIGKQISFDEGDKTFEVKLEDEHSTKLKEALGEEVGEPKVFVGTRLC